MSEPSISVTVPSYNRSARLAELLAAIVAQLHDGDELIVVDDASRDDSVQQARRFERCRVIVHETNQGMVKAWNACLHAASRDWICIIHNDDRIAPGALAAIRQAARLAPRAGLIAHKHMPEAMGGWRGEVWAAGPDAVLNSTVIPSGACVSRAALAALGDFDEAFAYSTDIEYFARVAARFDMVLIRSPQVVEYRLHDENHQYATWRKPDFFEQLEAIEDAVLGHAAVRGELREYLRNARWTGYLVYMFKNAARLKDKALLRMVGARLAERRDAGRRLRLLAQLARHSGWCPPDRSLRL
jgi:glycosyltransferase involved in cell wall biosynthesis